MAKPDNLQIDDPEALYLADQLSKRLQVTLRDAVMYALRAQVKTRQKPVDRAAVNATCLEIAALPVLDNRTPDEILGYDLHGIPR